MAVQIWRLFSGARLLQIFLQKMAGTKESYDRFVSVGCSLKEVCAASRHQEHVKPNTERCFVVEKFFSFKERAKRVGKYWCKQSRRVNSQFSTSSSKERRRTIRSHIAEVFCFKLVSAFSVQHFIAMRTQDVLRDVPLLLNLHLVLLFVICSF